jgi:hypothetical protein
MIRILTAALLGTSLMTAASYVTSQKKNKQFREPELLATLIKRLLPELKKEDAKLSGWLAHYGVGLLFCMIYDRIWSKTKITPSLANGLALGGVSGVLGAAVWKTTFALHPNPPENDRENFYGHLLIAHLIFGAGAVMGYRLGNNLLPNSKHEITTTATEISVIT